MQNRAASIGRRGAERAFHSTQKCDRVRTLRQHLGFVDNENVACAAETACESKFGGDVQSVAQWESVPCKGKVGGSNPSRLSRRRSVLLTISGSRNDRSCVHDRANLSPENLGRLVLTGTHRACNAKFRVRFPGCPFGFLCPLTETCFAACHTRRVVCELSHSR